MKVKMNDRELNLRSLNDKEYSQAERLARSNGVPLEVCLTCGARETDIPGSQGSAKEFKSGTYRYLGEEHECECDAQIALRARYLLANIGQDYMTLDWEHDYDGPVEVKNAVAGYLDKWESMRRYGIGLELRGGVGTGKTFAACHIGKELIKCNQRVLFIPFVEVVAAFQNENEEMFRRMRDITFLILDELLPAWTTSQHSLYAFQLEALIRHRTHHNLPTFITTNLTVKKLEEEYPRVYSLLSAKQMGIDFDGDDARKGQARMSNMELGLNQEVRPIT